MGAEAALDQTELVVVVDDDVVARSEPAPAADIETAASADIEPAPAAKKADYIAAETVAPRTGWVQT